MIKSIGFPKMFNGVMTNILTDREATMSNLKCLLYSDKYSLLGDPYYGTRLKKMLFDQNNIILRDLVIDDIFDAIVKFMPQIRVSRNDITITQQNTELYCTIKCTNLIDYTTDLYEINLTSTNE